MSISFYESIPWQSLSCHILCYANMPDQILTYAGSNGNFSCFYHCLVTFFKLIFYLVSFRKIIRVSDCLDPDQYQHSVSPDLGPNCLQQLSADDKSHR